MPTSKGNYRGQYRIEGNRRVDETEARGIPLVAIPRAQTNRVGEHMEEFRVALAEYRRHPYLSLRLWQRAQDGYFFPVPNKGCSVRLNEAQEVAAALLEGLRLANESEAGHPTPRPPLISATGTGEPGGPSVARRLCPGPCRLRRDRGGRPMNDDRLPPGWIGPGHDVTPYPVLDERSLRRPGWTEGRWIVLGDGRRWCLPSLVFKPSLDIRATGAALSSECTTIPELPGYMKIWKEAGSSGGLTAFFIRAIVSRMIRANYRIGDEEAGSLLPFGLDGIDPGFDSGVLPDAIKAVDELMIRPGMAAAILGITPPGVN